jgi:hypothetical protein
MAIDGCPLLSFFAFFLSLHVSRASTHSFLLQAKPGISTTAPRRCLAPRLASPRLTMQSPGCNPHFHREPNEKNQFTLSFSDFFSMTQIPNQVIAFLNESWNR